MVSISSGVANFVLMTTWWSSMISTFFSTFLATASIVSSLSIPSSSARGRHRSAPTRLANQEDRVAHVFGGELSSIVVELHPLAQGEVQRCRRGTSPTSRPTRGCRHRCDGRCPPGTPGRAACRAGRCGSAARCNWCPSPAARWRCAGVPVLPMPTMETRERSCPRMRR